MKYPRLLKKGDLVGVSAFSCGITDQPGQNNFINGQKTLKKKYDLNPIFTEDVFSDIGGKSASGEQRAKEFNDLVKYETPWIISAAGGDCLNEMLKFIDYKQFKRKPCWIQGYSDNTSILYALTTISDVATIYGQNFSAFGKKPYEKCQTQNIKLLMGESDTVESLTYYEEEFRESISGLEPFYKDKKVKWINGNKESKIEMEGRLLGGCTEVLFSLIGTPYEKTLEFCEKYKKDGIIFFFETFSSDDSNLHLHLWQLKEAGWFKYCKGIIFGRPLFYKSYLNKTYQEIVTETLSDLNIPMIFDADIGHKGPTIPMINGAYAKITSEKGKGKVQYIFK